VMVGDQIDTDGVGARSLGIRFIHIARNKRIKTPEWAEKITSLTELPDLLVRNKKNG
jgi:FMN phosphatase YigB (HAD superfamily)